MKAVQEVIYTEKEGYPLSIQSFERHEGYVVIKDENDIELRIYIISPFILRVRYSVEGYTEGDFSYALDPNYPQQDTSYTFEETSNYLSIKTEEVECRVSRETFKISFLDLQGNLISEDEKGYHWEKNPDYGGYIVQNSKKIQTGEAFYGLGDKPTELNLYGKRFVNWGTDEYGYHKDTDPLYKNIPIFYGLHDHIGYGIFFDNTFKSYFDFGKERSSVMSFWAQGGEMNYYFIAGPQLMDVCARYTLLTGTPDLPPLWALGYQQCKWSYTPDRQVKEIASKMRELEIPCDAIYLDIDYMDGFRCFTWNDETFPDPKGLINDLKDQGFKTMVIIDPGIKKDKEYSVFNEGLEKGYFCKRADGHYVEGKVWPGDCYFPDFTRPEVRTWWAGLYKELIEDIGVAGVWNDMNEPALFEVESKTFPMDVLHDYDGNLTSHRKAHNVYGMQMARATYDGVKYFRRGERTLIITRSGYSGLQRFSSVWTGDNIATWEHLWIADVQCQRLAISGISFAGSDIGGFINQPSSELMIRWIQMGIFHPFCRVHSSGDHGDQEPWSFGQECIDMFKKFVGLRYQLLPYLYTTFYQYHKWGLPFLRPLIFEDQSDLEHINRDHEFLCGDHILVCPVVKESAQSRLVYLPKGRWCNYWTSEVVEGNQEYEVQLTINEIPLFIRLGAIIPKYEVQQYVGEKDQETVILEIYPSEERTISYMYEDDANTYNYESGQSCVRSFDMERIGGVLRITQIKEGDFNSAVKNYQINIMIDEAGYKEISVDGKLGKYQEGILIKSDFEVLELV